MSTHRSLGAPRSKTEQVHELSTILQSGNRFLVVSHINPDGDAIGSLLGMHLALSEMGKESWPLTRDRVPELYHFLPGQKDLVPDATRLPHTPDWIIALDVATEPRISGDVARFRPVAKLINIDHHPTNPCFGDVNLVVPEASSTAELVFQVLKATGHPMSAEVGKCLYTGLVTDTGGFRFAAVNAGTLRMAAEMLDTGFDSYDVTRPIFEEHPLPRLLLERTMLERAEILLGGRLVLSILYADDFERLGAEFSDAENMVDRLRDSRGVAAGVLMTKMSDSLVRVSFRSKDEVDVAAVAGKFGGGGHRRAAGLRSSIPLPQLTKEIVQAIEQALTIR
jgi:bifunctional oligoribonuclease and PAP phosphatase NrnA